MRGWRARRATSSFGCRAEAEASESTPQSVRLERGRAALPAMLRTALVLRHQRGRAGPRRESASASKPRYSTDNDVTAWLSLAHCGVYVFALRQSLPCGVGGDPNDNQLGIDG